MLRTYSTVAVLTQEEAIPITSCTLYKHADNLYK